MATDLEEYYVAALMSVAGLGSKRARALVEHLGTAKNVWEASRIDLVTSKTISERVVDSLVALRKQEPERPMSIAKICSQKGISLCTIWQEKYPSLLREIYDPPVLFYYRGTLKTDAMRLAIVGSRRFTSYGESVAKSFSGELASCGLTIVSGAARGIDTCAHQGVVKNAKVSNGRTVAVLGCGVDIAYPAENRNLLEAIIDCGGAVISEYAPGTAPLPAFFPARNRIIAGLSQGTLVIEAAAKSGSLITAELALEENRDVYAVPSSIYAKNSEGCLNLIKQGAKLVSSVEDILKDYGVSKAKPAIKPKMNLSPLQKKVYQVLSFEKALSMDEIIESLPDADISTLSFTLLELQMEGIILETDDHAYRRTERI